LTIQERRDFGGEVLGVVARTVDEARLAPSEERHTDEEHPWGIDDTTVVSNQSLCVEHVHVEP
jgi:hypothetical protein